MAGSIKPAGMSPPPPPAEPEAQPVKARFELEQAKGDVRPPEGVAPGEAGRADKLSRTVLVGVEGLVAELQAGRITADQLVESLVQRALKSPMAEALTAEGRAGLEAHLRASLAEDPSLRGIVRDLSR